MVCGDERVWLRSLSVCAGAAGDDDGLLQPANNNVVTQQRRLMLWNGGMIVAHTPHTSPEITRVPT